MARFLLVMASELSSAQIDALLERAIAGDYESDDAWEAVSVLHLTHSRRVFDSAAAWCTSSDPLKRARGADILSQLGFPEEAFSLLVPMIAEKDVIAQRAAISALGHVGNAQAVPLIASFVNHADALIRLSVTHVLGAFANDPASVSGLLQLVRDPDPDVRDWAVFGLGVLGDVDSPEIRDALLRCLEDPDEDVREEAAVGLARRRDPRVVPYLRSMLSGPELKERVAGATATFLQLEPAPDDWNAEDYLAALG
jgi:HEAT repeat protein